MRPLAGSLNRARQRGDGDGGALIIAILLCIFLFSGDPDAWDRLHAYVMSIQPIAKP